MDKLSGMLLYVSIQKPVKAYVKPGAEKKPDEWKASIAIADEDVIDAFEDYAKSINTQVSVKKVKTAEFENIYKTAPPEDAGKNVWIVTLRKSTELGKTGKPVPDLYQPKVFEKVGNKIIDVTHSKLVGNGSIGQISIDEFLRDNGNGSLYLKNVLVTKLVEYTAPEGNNYQPGDEFDVADDGEGNDVKVPEKAKAQKPAAKKTANKSSGFDDMDDDVPF